MHENAGIMNLQKVIVDFEPALESAIKIVYSRSLLTIAYNSILKRFIGI